MPNKTLYLYLVSDSSGETVIAVSQAAVTQFSGLHIIEYMWPLVRSKEQIDDLKKALMVQPGIVIHTMLNGDVRDYLMEECQKMDIRCICPIESVLYEIANYINVLPSKSKPGKHAELYDYHMKQMESMNFALNHDDGAGIEDCYNADIILLGVSRTSKSPTSFYLAQRNGYKVSNIPIITGFEIDQYIEKCDKPLIVGLTISPQQLYNIRHKRFTAYGSSRNQILENYLSIESITDEIRYAEKLLARHRIKTIDVTAKAIEEIAAEIINLLFLKIGEKKLVEFTT